MDALKNGADALFILLGAIMILAMHAGFAFLELGTVRKKNQVNALVKILVDFAISTIAYLASASSRSRNSTVPTCPSTRSAPRRSANPAGSLCCGGRVRDMPVKGFLLPDEKFPAQAALQLAAICRSCSSLISPYHASTVSPVLSVSVSTPTPISRPGFSPNARS